MGCGSSTPSILLPDPQLGQEHSFMVKKAGMLSKGYNVYNTQKELWLYIRSLSSFWDSDPEFTLENFIRDEQKVGQVLGRCAVGKLDEDYKKEVDWENDSDDSDFSLDDLFGFDDDDELKVKLKFKAKREARFYNAQGVEFAHLKVKLKGKAKVEVSINEGAGGAKTELWNTKSAIKKVYYSLTINGVDLPIEFSNHKWQDWDRQWSVPGMFNATYNAKFGTDEVFVDTKFLQAPPADLLLMAFAIAYFMHPSSYLAQAGDDDRPLGHDTHNLFLYDKKNKERLFLVTLAQSESISLKELAKNLGAKEVRFAGGEQAANCLKSERGCITCLSLYYDENNRVQWVVSTKVLNLDKVCVCAGCLDPKDHTQHNVVTMTLQQISEVIPQHWQHRMDIAP
ncbi:hypothetical protein FOL47_007352 [Perkinsus chesapeaki]|uniref:YbaK/aminoacyl-tRNA synthetase-associated domain-containing protein n=1 Tax=Perkinsus chesapeaki TaxID=330153 RepID=A0A7J6LL92_PERCH|nr:hypothetical protein FOL47_007352 [Perkinsus chesapeaki]